MKKLLPYIVIVFLISYSHLFSRTGDPYLMYQEGVFQMEALADYEGAVGYFERVVELSIEDKPLVAKALFKKGLCYEKLGRTDAIVVYEEIVQNYSDVIDVVVEAQRRVVELFRGDVLKEDATPDEYFRLIDDLSDRILVEEGGTHMDRLMRIAGYTTNSLPALQAFIDGLYHVLFANPDGATRSFQRAVSNDSTFALAYYQGARIGYLTYNFQMAYEFIDKAMKYIDRLSPRDQLLVRGYRAIIYGNGQKVEDLYRHYIDLYPNDAHAMYKLAGDGIIRSANLRGRQWTESREVYERILELHPSTSLPQSQLARIALREKNMPEAEKWITYLLEYNWREEIPEWVSRVGQRLHAFATLNTDLLFEEFLIQRRRVAMYEENIEPMRLFQMVNGAYNSMLDLAFTKSVVSFFSDSTLPADLRSRGQITSAYLEFATGNGKKAIDILRNVPAIDFHAALPSMEFEGLMILAPFYNASPELLHSLRNRFTASLDTLESRNTWQYDLFAPHKPFHYYIHLYILGMLNARLGYYDEALRFIKLLEEIEPPYIAKSLPENLSSRIQAEIHRLQGNPRDALLALYGVENGFPIVMVLTSPLFAQPYERFIRGELYRELGQYKEALGWYKSIEGISVYDAPYLAPSYFRRAQIYGEFNEHEKSIEYYSLFVDLWTECDPEFAHLVREATARLEKYAIIE
jgi:tetratricopeptide (TPR) repeat protein